MVAVHEPQPATPQIPATGPLGHPRGLWVLGGTELWDRISFHGMSAMLVLYMTGELLQPQRAAHVMGFAAYRGALESVFGPLSQAQLATQTFGLYFAAITFLPIIGGWIGDKVTSRRVAVTMGALLMTAGHFSMAFDRTFLLALGLLALGAGLLRGNLAPQIGSLYAAGDRRLADAFQFYSFVANLGGFIAPIVSGTVAKYYGWHAGFAVAGFGMLIGLVWYLVGSRHLPPEPERNVAVPRPPLTPIQRRNLIGLFALWPVAVAFWTAQAQIWNVYNLWVRDHIEMRVSGFDVPIPWLQSLDGLAPAIYAPLVVLLWRYQAQRHAEPDVFIKLFMGCGIFSLATFLLAAAPYMADHGGRGPLWIPVMFHLISNLGVIYFVPVMRAFYASRAPEHWRGTVLGIDTLAVSAASLLSGTMGGWYERMSPSQFWSLNGLIVGGAGVVVLLVQRPLRRWMDAETPASAR